MAKKPTSEKNPKKGAGRPRLEFDLKQVEQLAAIQCTDGELAAVLNCSRDTILRRKAEGQDFAAAIERGRESGKASLRRMQWKAANAGSNAMLIWLGKQYLGQRDKMGLEGSDPGDPMAMLVAAIDAHEPTNLQDARKILRSFGIPY